jgi:hypothetical protein
MEQSLDFVDFPLSEVLSRGCQKTKLNLIPGGASAPPDPPNKSAWRPPKWLIYIGFSM